MTPDQVVIVSTLGWILAALFVGLWWGERGRRRDAQWTAAGKPPLPGGTPKATAMMPRNEGSHINEGPTEDEIREKLIAEAMADGFPRDMAEKDADEMLSRIKADGPISYGAPPW